MIDKKFIPTTPMERFFTNTGLLVGWVITKRNDRRIILRYQRTFKAKRTAAQATIKYDDIKQNYSVFKTLFSDICRRFNIEIHDSETTKIMNMVWHKLEPMLKSFYAEQRRKRHEQKES